MPPDRMPPRLRPPLPDHRRTGRNGAGARGRSLLVVDVAGDGEDDDDVPRGGGGELLEQLVARAVGAHVVVDGRGEGLVRAHQAAVRRVAGCAEGRRELGADAVPGLGAHLAVLEHAQHRYGMSAGREVRRKVRGELRLVLAGAAEDEREDRGRPRAAGHGGAEHAARRVLRANARGDGWRGASRTEEQLSLALAHLRHYGRLVVSARPFHVSARRLPRPARPHASGPAAFRATMGTPRASHVEKGALPRAWTGGSDFR